MKKNSTFNEVLRQKNTSHIVNYKLCGYKKYNMYVYVTLTLNKSQPNNYTETSQYENET